MPLYLYVHSVGADRCFQTSEKVGGGHLVCFPLLTGRYVRGCWSPPGLLRNCHNITLYEYFA